MWIDGAHGAQRTPELAAQRRLLPPRWPPSTPRTRHRSVEQGPRFTGDATAERARIVRLRQFKGRLLAPPSTEEAAENSTDDLAADLAANRPRGALGGRLDRAFAVSAARPGRAAEEVTQRAQ